MDKLINNGQPFVAQFVVPSEGTIEFYTIRQVNEVFFVVDKKHGTIKNDAVSLDTIYQFLNLQKI